MILKALFTSYIYQPKIKWEDGDYIFTNIKSTDGWKYIKKIISFQKFLIFPV